MKTLIVNNLSVFTFPLIIFFRILNFKILFVSIEKYFRSKTLLNCLSLINIKWFNYQEYKINHIEIDKPFTSYPKKLAKHLSKKYNIQKKNNLLELGCGRGEFLKGFSDIGVECYGVDLSDYAKKICSSAHISKVNLVSEKLPFQENFFDFIAI